MKKKSVYIVLAAAFAAACLLAILFKTGVVRSKDTPQSDLFAVKDTATVTKIFIADMNGESVLLTRRNDVWYVEDTVRAMPEKVEQLLSVISNVTMLQTVAKTAQSNINKMMSANAVKVEIYRTAPKFKVFGLKCFTKERLAKTYYMGPATMDNMANFAILEGFGEPCIVGIPGFRGFLTPSYSFRPADWYNCDLFTTKITRIKTLAVQDYEHPEESFTVEKAGTRFFSLFDARHNPVMHYDTVRLIDMLAEYRDKNFERPVVGMTASARDSIIGNNHFKTIRLTDVNGKTTTLDLYRKLAEDNLYLDAVIGGVKGADSLPYNRDKFYAVSNGRYDRLVQCQYYHFDRQLQPLSYFLKP